MKLGTDDLVSGPQSSLFLYISKMSIVTLRILLSVQVNMERERERERDHYGTRSSQTSAPQRSSRSGYGDLSESAPTRLRVRHVITNSLRSYLFCHSFSLLGNRTFCLQNSLSRMLVQRGGSRLAEAGTATTASGSSLSSWREVTYR